MNKGPWGGNGDNNSWNNNDNSDNVKEFKTKKKDNIPPIHFSLGIKVVIAIVFGLWLLTGFYEVHPEEQGVVLRFGKYVGTTGPGLNYHLPYPIENVLLPNITRENRIAIGLKADASHYEYSKSSSKAIQSRPDEAVMLTGDENIVELEYTVTWKIKDSKQFLFKVKDPEITVKKAAESAMREVIGQTPIINALTEGKRDIQSQTRNILQKLLDDYQAGISVTSVQLLRVDPPNQVIDAFVDVQRAKADKERLKNEAQAYSGDIIPRARGEAKQTIINAEAYKEQVINLAKGEASRFNSVYQEYKLAKEVTLKRMYIEAMEEVMSETNKVLLDDKAGSVLPYLPLNSINKKAK